MPEIFYPSNASHSHGYYPNSAGWYSSSATTVTVTPNYTVSVSPTPAPTPKTEVERMLGEVEAVCALAR